MTTQNHSEQAESAMDSVTKQMARFMAEEAINRVRGDDEDDVDVPMDVADSIAILPGFRDFVIKSVFRSMEDTLDGSPEALGPFEALSAEHQAAVLGIVENATKE